MTKTNNDSMNDDEDCPLLPPSNLKATMPTQPFSSWGDAFQFAASVKPQDLGTFNPPSTTGNDSSATATYDPTDKPRDVAAISLIAKEYNSSISKKRKSCETNTESETRTETGSSGGHGNQKEEGEEDPDKVKARANKKLKKEKKIRKEGRKKAKKEKTKQKQTAEESQLKSSSSSSPAPAADPPSPDDKLTTTCSSSSKKKKSKKEKKAKKEKKKDKARRKQETMTGGSDQDGKDARSTTASPAPSAKKSKLNETVASDDQDAAAAADTSTAPLEGQMVMHNDEAIMVLIDRPNKVVYSMDRDEATGKLRPIGAIVNGKVTITTTNIVGEATSTGGSSSGDFPYRTDPDDHCESPMDSYKDIQPILDSLAKSNSASGKSNLIKIYDPYYCNGLVKDNLAQMGYTNVYNVKEDAYKTWDDSDSSQPYPEYDIFITNPPYSEDHIERLMNHLTTSHRVVGDGKPWCLLMPTYVHKKDYYKQIIAKKRPSDGGARKSIQPFYLVPKKRYVYLPPKNFREKKDSDVHKKSSPFVSMWHIWGGSTEKTESLIRAYQKHGDGACELARSVSALRDLRRKGKGDKDKKGSRKKK